MTYAIISPSSPPRSEHPGPSLMPWDQGGNSFPFDSTLVRRIKKGGARRSLHIPTQAPSLTPLSLLAVAAFLTTLGPQAAMPLAALLIGYFTFIRQSNLVSPSAKGWRGPLHLAAGRHPPAPPRSPHNHPLLQDYLLPSPGGLPPGPSYTQLPYLPSPGLDPGLHHHPWPGRGPCLPPIPVLPPRHPYTYLHTQGGPIGNWGSQP